MYLPQHKRGRHASVGLGLAGRIGFRLFDKSASCPQTTFLRVAVIYSKFGENLGIPPAWWAEADGKGCSRWARYLSCLPLGTLRSAYPKPMGKVEGNSIQPHCICLVLSTQASLAPNSLGPGFSPLLRTSCKCPMFLYTVSFWNISARGMAVFHPLLYPTCPHMLLLCNRCSFIYINKMYNGRVSLLTGRGKGGEAQWQGWLG